MNIVSEAEEFFAGVTGQECWSVIGGAGSGSVISFQFGARVARSRALKNPTLSEEERLFEGERSLLVLCDWRLEAEHRILSTSQTVTAEGALDVSEFARVRGQKVRQIGFSSKLHDLRIEFEQGVSLAIFADLPVSEDANYTLYNPTNCVSVTGLSLVVVEPRRR